ncbi:MAG: hypothetical protein JWN71_2796 [Xanthobacteraceae bacterium]|jgi:hypothetical protein|nr:hypothetical protein [Xanthobacteraceae bacterium]
MKMNPAQIEQTLHQFNAKAIPPADPIMSQLEKMFGDHTYFLDSKGLNIVEPVNADQDNGPLGVVVNLADWEAGDGTMLKPHQPEKTELVVQFEAQRHH